jgi:hypothetical protein
MVHVTGKKRKLPQNLEYNLFFLIFALKINKRKMRNVDYTDNQITEVIDFAPETTHEAHLRIMDAECGIANGETILHEDVISQSYKLLEKYDC